MDSGTFLAVPARATVDAAIESLLRATGLDVSGVATPRQMAEWILGQGAVRMLPQLPGRAALSIVGHRWYIYLRPGLSQAEKDAAIAHELGEWWLRVSGYAGDDVEVISCEIADRLLQEVA